jgi:hypothetical protein
MFRISVMLSEGNTISRSDISMCDLLEPRPFGRKSLEISVSGTSAESHLGAEAKLAIITVRNLGPGPILVWNCDVIG